MRAGVRLGFVGMGVVCVVSYTYCHGKAGRGRAILVSLGEIFLSGVERGILSFQLFVLFTDRNFKKEEETERAKCFRKCQCNEGRERVISALFAFVLVISSKENLLPAAHTTSPPLSAFVCSLFSSFSYTPHEHKLNLWWV